MLRVVAAGDYRAQDLRQAWQQAQRHPQWPQVREVILDLHRSDSVLSRSVRELRSISGFFAVELSKYGLSCALIVSDGVRYGLMRMVAAWVSRTVTLGVFRDEREARRWLTMRSAAAS